MHFWYPLAVFPSRNNSLWAALLIALAIACGVALARQFPAGYRSPAVEWLATPRPLPEFSLRSSAGAFTRDSLQGQWQLLVLGFTHCPDLCPTTLSQLVQLQAAMPAYPLQVIFVSVDPLRDSPLQLAAYVEFLGSAITGVTGSDVQLHNLARALGMDFRREGTVDQPDISHSPAIALIGADGLLHARLRPGFNAAEAAREISARARSSS